MPISFIKRGKDAHRAFAEDERLAKARKAAQGVRRFWVPNDSESRVTFLDGKLDEDGLLELNTFDQHNMKINGRWRNYFACVADSEPCPLCEDGDYVARVALFTVLDHTPFTDRNGKKHVNERKLFVAKRETMNRLQKLAAKRGGLRGWTVAVGRYGERTPEVGTDFDFEEKHNLKQLAGELSVKLAEMRPFDYEEEIKKIYKTADELRELGFGSTPVGKADSRKSLGKPSKAKSDDDDFDEDLDDEDDVFDDEDAEEVTPAAKKAAAKKAAAKKAASSPAKKAFGKTAKKAKAAPPEDIDDDLDDDDADAEGVDEDDDDLDEDLDV